MRTPRKSARSSRSLALATVAAAAATALPAVASAQSRTFHLDRLELWGAPDDGVTVARPVVQPRATLFGQLGLGFSYAPLRTSNITTDTKALTKANVVTAQFTLYGNAGFQLFDRFSVGVGFPVSYNAGSNPDYGRGQFNPKGGTPVGIQGAAAGDLRLDARMVVVRSKDRQSAFGIQGSFFAPTGSTNMGGDRGAGAMALLLGETKVGPIILAGNAGVHFRPRNSINDATTAGKGNGLGISDEFRYSVAGFLPLADGRYRLGLSLMGQTGLSGADDPVAGKTFFTKNNTPLEWHAEGRMKFGPGDAYWLGASAGTRLTAGYGSPDFRMLVLAGTYIPLEESFANAPDPRMKRKAQWKKEGEVDTDHDGIPDYLDACPLIPEDGKPPSVDDGCPTNDRDGDGIPDVKDKCPDVPEDKDGIDDTDGCPEDDVDNDGIADAEDACPREPGKKSPDPAKNGCPEFITREGDQLRIFQQIHFANNSAVILADSFPILEELGAVLKANPGIKRLAVEGHTDNKGSAEHNKTLSQARADSVMKWFTTHGIAADRLEAHGYGLERPIDTNATDAGRAKNRRCEFKILKEETVD